MPGIDGISMYPRSILVRVVPTPSQPAAVVGVPIAIGLLDAKGSIRAFVVAGKTGQDGTLQTSEAQLQALFSGQGIFDEPTAPGQGLAMVLGGRQLDRLLRPGYSIFSADDRRRLDTGPTTKAEWEERPFSWTAAPVACVLPVVPVGGVTSDKADTRKTMLICAAAAMFVGLISFIPKGPSRLTARGVAPLAAAWLIFELWWRARHRAVLRELAGIR